MSLVGWHVLSESHRSHSCELHASTLRSAKSAIWPFCSTHGQTCGAALATIVVITRYIWCQDDNYDDDHHYCGYVLEMVKLLSRPPRSERKLQRPVGWLHGTRRWGEPPGGWIALMSGVTSYSRREHTHFIRGPTVVLNTATNRFVHVIEFAVLPSRHSTSCVQCAAYC